MDVLVAEFQTDARFAYLAGVVHFSRCCCDLREVEVSVETMSSMPFVAVVVGAI